MKIDEAIDILTIHNDHNPDFTDAERRQAHQLGIEALRAYQKAQSADWYPPGFRLPGETEE